jgi:hypothetical protein
MSLLRSVPRFLIDHSCLALLPVGMHFIDALSLGLSFLGIYGLVFSIRFLIPCYIIPFISAHLTSTQQLLNHAEAINAIPPESEYRTHFDLYEKLFVLMAVFSYTWMQFGEPICGDAYREQSRPGALPATASCCSARLDLPTLRPLLSDRGNEVKARGSIQITLVVRHTNKTRLSWRLTNNGFASHRVPPEQLCPALQSVCIRPPSVYYALSFIDDR